MAAARGTLTSRGGKTSHAAVVARGMGRPCVCGAEALIVDLDARQVQVRGGPVIKEGDVISVDGSSGAVYAGAVPVVDSVVVRYFDGEEVDDPVVEAVAALLGHADGVRRMDVRANADTPEDATRARRFGAGGIGLCRTEHMFLGDRRVLVENLVLADDEAGRNAALAEMLPQQREDFAEILAAMDGLPVTIRLIDPPLHEFLPDLTALSVRVEREDERGEVDTGNHRLLAAVRALHEQNPMLGLRGVRLGRRRSRAGGDAGAGGARGGRRPDRRRRRSPAGDHGAPGRRPSPSWRTYDVGSSRWPPRSRRSAGSPYRTASGR